jgi:DNA repair protein RadD
MRPGFFNDIVDVVQIEEMLNGGWWTPLKYHGIPYDRRDLKPNSTGSEYTELSNRAAFVTNKIMEKAVKHAIQGLEKGRRKIIAYFPSVALAKEFARLTPDCVAISSDMSAKEYKEAMEGWYSGKYRIISNVDIFTTGFDDPEIDMLLICKAMMSMADWYQMIGRGTRIDPLGIKTECWVVDYCGNLDRFGKVEHLTVEDVPHYGWGMFGEGGRLLTDLRMDGSEVRHDKKIWTRDNCAQLQHYRSTFYRNDTL